MQLLADHGAAPETVALIAARRAFVEMKQCYLEAAADTPSSISQLLSSRILKATEPCELWAVRAVLLASLSDDHERTPEHMARLGREMDSVFSGATF